MKISGNIVQLKVIGSMSQLEVSGSMVQGGPFNWAAFWARQGEPIFFGEVSKITDGKLYNQKSGATDYLTVTGAAGSYTFQCPNTAPYIAADTDYIWFKTDETPRTTTTAELVGYDLPRTPVKYDDADPYSIRWIMILKAGGTLSADKVNKLHSSFCLPLFWSGVENIYGHLKGNRGLTQKLWIFKLTGFVATWANDYASMAVDAVPDDVQVEWYESKDGGSNYTLIDTTAVGVYALNNYTWQGMTMYFKCRSLKDGNYSDYTAPLTLATPLTFKTDQSTLTHIDISFPAGGTIIVYWGDGTHTTGATDTEHDYGETQNPYYITITSSNDFSGIGTISMLAGGITFYGDLSKWVIPASVTILGFQHPSNYCKFTGGLSNWTLVALTKFKAYYNHFTAPPRGNLLTLDSDYGINMTNNNCNTASLDSWLAYANTFFGANTPTQNIYIDISGALMGIPTGGNNNTDRLGIIAKFTAAGFTATIKVRTS